MARQVTTKHRWVWVVIFIAAVLLLGTLATGWNVVLIERMREVELRPVPQPKSWLGIILGTLGFVGLLGGMILFFVRLLQEMKLNQLQSEFIAAVSHELKTPIATLELSSSLIREAELTEEEKKKLWASHDAELSRLKDQVEALLEAAQWQSNVMEARTHVIVLEEWVEESLERWRHILGPGATLERAGDPLPCRISVDVRMLNRIVDNLIDNARKFARGTPEVTIRTEMDGEFWRLKVLDRGWGFDPADADRIMKRFVRGKSDAPYSIPGTGLGLYLATVACKAMGIHLRAESAGHGRGAQFSLEGPHR